MPPVFGEVVVDGAAHMYVPCEFDAAAGTPPNPANWTYEINDVTSDGENGWGNEELQYDTDDLDNAANFAGSVDQSSADALLGSADALLGPLADNGGVTLTHLTGAASPAIDNGNVVGCQATDQRGVTRPQGSGYDAGAVEVVPDTLIPPCAVEERPSAVAGTPLGDGPLDGERGGPWCGIGPFLKIAHRQSGLARPRPVRWP